MLSSPAAFDLIFFSKLVGLKHIREGKIYASHLEEECMSEYVNRHRPIGDEDKGCIYGTKDDPVSSHNLGVPSMNQRPRIPTTVSVKGGNHPDR
jgi:hypothetical protein